ncbi:retrovirus-related pol polyprotein from transposon TNT 1-94 [Tanacetum coccineum]
MHDEFEMSMMGELNFFLGLQIKQMEDGIFFNQSKYIKEMLKKFGLEDSKPMKTHMSYDTKLMKDEDCESVFSTKYRGMIGSLLYLMASRPDIMFSVCLCARFQEAPKTSHLEAVKRIFRYIKGTTHLGLWYPKRTDIETVVYADSDHAGDYVDRKSISDVIVDENDDESFHSNSSSSPFQNVYSSSNVIPRVIQTPPHESHYLNTHLSETTNLQTQQRDAHREGLRSLGQAVKNMMKGKRNMRKGLLGPNGGSGRLIEGRLGERCGGNGRRGGSMSGVGEGKVDSMGEMRVGAEGGEVNGGGVDFKVSKRLLFEVSGEMIGKRSGIEVEAVGGGAET